MRNVLAWCWVLLLFGPTLLVRFGAPEWIEYGHEQESMVLQAVRALRGEGLSYGYANSLRLEMPPFTNWLLALGVAIDRDPVWATTWIGLLDLAGLALTFLVLRPLFGRASALQMVALCAALPWHVVYARKIWGQDLLFFTSSVAWLLLFSNLRAYARWKTVLFLLAGSLWLQCHLSAFFAAVPLLAALVLLGVRWPRRDVALGALAALAAWLPWLVHQAAQGFDQLAYAWNTLQGDTAPLPLAQRLRESLGWTQALCGGSGFEYLFGEERFEALLHPPALLVANWAFRLLGAATLALAAAGLARAALRRRARGPEREAREQALALFSGLTALLALVYVLAGIRTFPHYFIVLLPAGSVLAVRGLERLRERLGAPSWTQGAAVAALVLASAFFLRACYLDMRGHPIPDGRAAWMFAPDAPRWRARMDGELEDVFPDPRERPRIQARLERRFRSSSEVLARWEPSAGPHPLRSFGPARLRQDEGGILVSGGSPRAGVILPALDVPPDRSVILRLELTAPRLAGLQVFGRGRGAGGFDGFQQGNDRPPAGRVDAYLELPSGTGFTGGALVRTELASWRLHAFEARAVPAEADMAR